jgi:hypothetical protein
MRNPYVVWAIIWRVIFGYLHMDTLVCGNECQLKLAHHRRVVFYLTYMHLLIYMYSS